MTHRERPGREAGTISLDLDLHHSPATVWRALTEPALLAEWLLPVVERELALAPGRQFTFQAPPHGAWDGSVRCRLLEIEPLRRLRYSWVVDDTRGIDTEVTFVLAATEHGTRLSITHSGFKLPAQKGAMGGTEYGWTMMTGRLAELLGRVS